LALLGGLGIQELIPIIIVVLLLFGAKNIPTLMRGMGQGIKEFKSAIKDDDQPATAPPSNAPPAPQTGGPTVNPTTSDEQPS